MTGEQRYVAYLLRLWQVTSDEGPVWQASLQDVHTGERLGFASVERLVAFLQELTGGVGQREADGESTAA